MRFVLKLSYACARHLASALNEKHNKKAVYYYGFFIVFATLIEAGILILTSLLFGTLIPSLIIVAIFGTLRLFAGGYHFDTLGRCLFISLGFILAVALASQYTYQYWSTISVIIFLMTTFTVGLIIFIKYAPKDTPTKPITDPAKSKKLKKLSVLYLCILLLICSILTILSLKLYVIATCFGVLLEIFSVSPVGHAFFDKIKNGLNNASVSN